MIEVLVLLLLMAICLCTAGAVFVVEYCEKHVPKDEKTGLPIILAGYYYERFPEEKD